VIRHVQKGEKPIEKPNLNSPLTPKSRPTILYNTPSKKANLEKNASGLPLQAFSSVLMFVGNGDAKTRLRREKKISHSKIELYEEHCYFKN
jgi:hypothetical protein